MAIFKAGVHVTLRPVVNDPQGLTIKGALHSLGFSEVEDVRAGKFIEVNLEAPDERAARSSVDAMCRELLANPVIEDYRFDLEQVGQEVA